MIESEQKMQLEEEKKKAALAEQEATKHELIAEVFEIMKEFAILEGFDEKLFNFTEEDIDRIIGIEHEEVISEEKAEVPLTDVEVEEVLAFVDEVKSE